MNIETPLNYDGIADQDSLTQKPDFSQILDQFFLEFSEARVPLEVDFRKLVKFHSGIDRYTHLIHAYPAKLLLNIPYFFINCTSLVNDGDTVLDPFSGSGTVLLESILSGKNALGADANPLARLISRCKVTPLLASEILERLTLVLDSVDSIASVPGPQKLLDWNLWYPEQTQRKLGQLAAAIDAIPHNDLKLFFACCLSQTSRKVSLADPRVSVPVRLNPKRYARNSKLRAKINAQLKNLQTLDAFEVFVEVVRNNARRVDNLKTHAQRCNIGEANLVSNDARNLSKVPDCSIDLIITSPPYAGAQKYIRSSSLSIGWLGLSPDGSLRSLEKQNIGREHYYKSEYQTLAASPSKTAHLLLQEIHRQNPLRAHIAGNYLTEMEAALRECHRTLKHGKKLVLVVGNNVVCGYNFETQKYLNEIAETIGFKTKLILRDDIHSRGLMTKRNKTASVITCEWIVVLEKP